MVETFLRYYPSNDRRSVHHFTKAFELLVGLFPSDKPLPDTSTFKPGYLIWYKRSLIEQGYAKSQVKRYIKVVKQVFSWAATPRYDEGTWDILPTMVSASLIAEMKMIKVTDADNCRENPLRLDVAYEYIQAVMDYVSPIIEAMMRVQYLTGMRPGEVCTMKVGDIKKTKAEFGNHYRLWDGENWLYVAAEHKTKKYIGERQFAIAMEEQEILEPYLAGKSASDFVFSKTSKRGFGKPFTTDEYGRYIKRTIEKYELEKFTAHQIKHSAVSDTSEKHNRDKARALAGHTSETMTARYDHSDDKKLFAMARERNREYLAKITATNSVPFNLRIYNG
ncbi:integrase [Planctomycetales bacterium]|nr:integrase [Planctomycetales bacterium]